MRYWADDFAHVLFIVNERTGDVVHPAEFRRSRKNRDGDFEQGSYDAFGDSSVYHEKVNGFAFPKGDLENPDWADYDVALVDGQWHFNASWSTHERSTATNPADREAYDLFYRIKPLSLSLFSPYYSSWPAPSAFFLIEKKVWRAFTDWGTNYQKMEFFYPQAVAFYNGNRCHYGTPTNPWGKPECFVSGDPHRNDLQEWSGVKFPKEAWVKEYQYDLFQPTHINGSAYTEAFGKLSVYNGESVESTILRMFNRIYEPGCDADRFLDYGKLAQARSDCSSSMVESARVMRMNFISYLIDAKSLISSLSKGALQEAESIADALRTVLDSNSGWRKKAKKIASAHLSCTYGNRLEYLDTKTVIQSLIDETKQQNRYRIMRSQFTAQSTLNWFNEDLLMTYHEWLKARYDSVPSELADYINELQRYSIFPETSEVWDLIPFSFVIDWALPVSDLLEQLDNRTFAATLPIVASLKGSKLSVSVPKGLLLSLGLDGNARIVRYERSHTPIPPIFPHLRQGGDFHSWLELSAIAVQTLL